MTSQRGYHGFAFGIVDEFNRPIEAASITSVTVLTVNTRNTAATLYKDDAGTGSFTNPQVSFLDSSSVKFFGSAIAYDVIVTLSNGVCVRQNGVTSTDSVVVRRAYLTIDGAPTINAAATGTITQYVYPQDDGSLLIDLNLAGVVVDMGLTATNAAAFGGTLLTTFASCEANVIGVGGKVSFGIADAQSQYANDATPEGTLAFGTGIKDDAADCGAADATDDDLLETEDFVMAAYIDAAIPLEAAEGLTVDGTPAINVNASIDASELADTTGPNAKITGWARFRASFTNAS